MFRRICLVTWKQEVEPEQVAEFLQWADEHFTSAPFRAASHGPNTAAGVNGPHWAYIIDFDREEEVMGWNDCDFHKRLSGRIGGNWANPPFEGMLETGTAVTWDIPD